MKSYLFFLAILAVLIPTVLVFAQVGSPDVQEPLILTDGQEKYSLGRHMAILEDPDGVLTIDQVSSTEFASRFTSSPADIPNFGYTDTVYWLRLPLRNDSQLVQRWLLEVNFPNLNFVDLYLPDKVGGYQVKESGALKPFSTRDIPYYHVVFYLPIAAQAEETFYIRVASGSSMTLEFTLWSPVGFAMNKIVDMLGQGLFYGALLVMLGYHLILFFSLREASYFYFVLFLGSAILFFATYEGVADQFIWPGMSQQKLSLLVITMSVFFMFAMKFSTVFLEQKQREPLLERLFNLIIVLWGMMILILPFANYITMAQIASVMLLGTPAFAAFAGIYNWRKGNPLARFYLISWIGFIVGVISAELVRSGVFPSNLLTERFYQVGLIWLVVAWAFALSDRINSLKRETEAANQRLQQSENKLSRTLERLPIGVVVYGLDRKPTYANKRAREMLSNPERGLGVSVSAGRTLAQAMKYFSFRFTGSDKDYPIENNPIYQAFDGRITSVDDIEADLIDRRVPLEVWANPVKDDRGRVESVVAAFQDITQRKQIEVELEEHRLHLEQIVHQRTSQLSDANNRLKAEIFERHRLESMLHKRLEWLKVVNQINQTIAQPSNLPQAYQVMVGEIKHLFDAMDAFLAQFDAQKNTILLLAHSCRNQSHPELTGTEFWISPELFSEKLFGQSKPVTIERDQLVSLEEPVYTHFHCTDSQILILIPISSQAGDIGLLGLEFQEAERIITSDEMILVNEIYLDIIRIKEKALLAHQSQAIVAAEERSRLGRDLHDSVTQVLFAASLVAEVLPKIWRRDPERALVSLDELRRLTRGALAEMRTTLLELRPASIVKLPMSELLTQLTESVTIRTGLSFQLFVEQIPPLPEKVHMGFYRIAQESLNNVVKHSQASQVSVSLGATPLFMDSTDNWKGELRLMVRDDGCGFDEKVEGFQHLGLSIMRERAESISAQLSVESQPGQGTTVILTWQN